MAVSRCGTASRSSAMPTPPLPAISTEEEVSPAAPMSWMATIASVAISSRHASISSFSVNGSPTCTVGRFASAIRAELRARHGGAMDAVPPGLAADIHHRVADPAAADRKMRSARRDADRHGVDQRVAVVGRVEVDLAAHRRHADAVAVAADAAHHAVHHAPSCPGWSGLPKRRALRLAIGRAPMVNTSRMMPPTPVAAPWYGSMKLGWLCDSILNTAARPSPMSTTPAFSPGPWTTQGAAGGQLLQPHAGGFV